MPAHIQITSRSFLPFALAALAVITVACSGPTGSDEKATERIMPVARFEMAGAAAPPAVAADTENAESATASGQKDGATVYAQICKTCHDHGISGAPKIGDKAAWEPRLATGMETLYNSSLHGKNVMPPKGGNSSLSDEEVRSAVDFMVDASH
ncbi:MAG: c-type cytochrome [Betaproteobacteria bacterium]|nr:c-type cytochrome [Betaproteobacteria bacterium]